MEWHLTDAQSLSIIDQEIGDHGLSPAEYEITRRVIYETADFEYKSLMRFSERSLQAGAAALAARTTIVVDVPMVQVGIVPLLQNTFANPVYCSMETVTRPQKDKTQSAWGMETLARRYPEGVFVVGKSQTALTALSTLIREEEVRPALIVATPAGFVGAKEAKNTLRDLMIPHICIQGRKGSAVVAVAIMSALIELSWQAYGQETKS